MAAMALSLCRSISAYYLLSTISDNEHFGGASGISELALL